MQILRLVFPNWRSHRAPAMVLPKGIETLSLNKDFFHLHLPSPACEKWNSWDSLKGNQEVFTRHLVTPSLFWGGFSNLDLAKYKTSRVRFQLSVNFIIRCFLATVQTDLQASKQPTREQILHFQAQTAFTSEEVTELCEWYFKSQITEGNVWGSVLPESPKGGGNFAPGITRVPEPC